VLAVLSVVGGWVGLPLHALWGNQFGHFLEPVFGHSQHALHLSTSVELLLMGCSVAVALGGLGLAYLFYVAQPEMPERLRARAGRLYDVVYNKYYVDEIYDAVFVRPTVAVAGWLWRAVDVAVIDGLVNGSARLVAENARVWRRLQSGNVQHYALSMLGGVLLVLGYLILN